MKHLCWLLALWVGFAVCGAQQDEAAAPVRAARLTYFAGAVQVERQDNTGVDEPVMNMPIGEGTRLVCGNYGEAEIEFEDGSLVRITPRSTVTVDALGLEGGVAQTAMTVLSGLVYFELRKSPGYVYNISADGVHLTPTENAVMRISFADPNTPAEFSVLSGTIRVDRGFSTEVHAGESLHADAKDSLRYFLNSQIVPETWDSWNDARDRAAADETEQRTAARDVYAGVQGYGWSDLDANGTWYDVPGEGEIWQPDVADEGFDPYGYGGWVWQGVGYVWASGYRWGWTPFRCGRWEFYPGFGWGWAPDQQCGRWGSHGGLVLVGVKRPEHYKFVQAPPKQPVKVHPIVIVLGPNGPRPPILTGGEKQIHGKLWAPLARVGGVAHSGPALGLSRDYPVNLTTHLAVQGKVAKEDPLAGNQPSGVAAGWRSVTAQPAPATGAPVTRQRPVPTAPPPVANPSATSRTPLPAQAPLRITAPVQAPAAQRPAPAPPPPVYRAPAPAPAPAAAPPKVETSKPK